MKNLGFYNGKYDEMENMSIPMGDRVCFFGDGIYDATYSRNYKIFSVDDHINRFFNSAKLTEIELPYTKEELKNLLYEMVDTRFLQPVHYALLQRKLTESLQAERLLKS